MNDISGQVSLDSRGALHGVGPLTADQQQAVRQALTEQKLSFPTSWRELRGEPGVLMGAAERAPFQLESPVATAVRSTRPTLSWTSDPQSIGYRVTLRDDNTGQTTTKALLEATAWTNSSELERGHVYGWQVVSSRKNGAEVLVPHPPSPAAKFLVVDAATNAKLEQLPRSHLVRAVLYGNAGLLDDANRELTALQEPTIATSSKTRGPATAGPSQRIESVVCRHCAVRSFQGIEFREPSMLCESASVRAYLTASW